MSRAHAGNNTLRLNESAYRTLHAIPGMLASARLNVGTSESQIWVQRRGAGTWTSRPRKFCVCCEKPASLLSFSSISRLSSSGTTGLAKWSFTCACRSKRCRHTSLSWHGSVTRQLHKLRQRAVHPQPPVLVSTDAVCAAVYSLKREASHTSPLCVQ